MDESPTIVVYGAGWCPDVLRTRRFLERYTIPYTYRDIDADPAALDFANRAHGGDWIVPTIAFGDGSILFNPNNKQLRAKLVELALLSENEG